MHEVCFDLFSVYALFDFVCIEMEADTVLMVKACTINDAKFEHSSNCIKFD